MLRKMKTKRMTMERKKKPLRRKRRRHLTTNLKRVMLRGNRES